MGQPPLTISAFMAKRFLLSSKRARYLYPEFHYLVEQLKLKTQ